MTGDSQSPNTQGSNVNNLERPTRATLVSFLVALMALLWSAYRSGIGIYPALTWQWTAIESWPQRSTEAFQGYISDSPTGPILAKLLGLSSQNQYVFVHLLASLIVILLLASWAFTQFENSHEKWLAVRLSFLAPISAVLFTWIGTYDVFTVLGWAIALYAYTSRKRFLILASGIFLGFQHFEHSLFALAIFAIIILALGDRLPRTLLPRLLWWMAGGLLLGRALLGAIFMISGQGATTRSEWITTFVKDWTVTGVNIGPQLLWSLFAGFWILVLALFLGLRNHRPRFLLAAAFGLGLVATLLSGDRPRIFIIVMFPALMLALVAYIANSRDSPRERKLVEFSIWLAPVIFFWGNSVFNSNSLDLFIMTVNQLRG